MKILLIDNYDSFIYNLKYEFELFNCQVTVCRNDINFTSLQKLINEHQAIVISPGPGYPKNAGHCIEVIKQFYRTKPILGVCLGHQAIVEAFDGKVEKAAITVHGKFSPIEVINKEGLFNKLGTSMNVARYHSLVATSLASTMNIDAVAALDKKRPIMAVSHKQYPTYGLQFHPESIMSFDGEKLLKNFLSEVRKFHLTQEKGVSHATSS